MYSAAIGIGAGAWFTGHPFRAVVLGLVCGLLIGLVLDWVLRRRGYLKRQVADPADPAPIHTVPAADRDEAESK